MTREEYIDFANALKNNYTIDFDKLPEFCDMAISALSAEGEYIKKEDIVKYIDNMPSELTEDGRRMVRQIRLKEFVADLPTYSFPDREKGEWIKIQSGDDKFPESIVCSKCKNENSHLDFDEHGEPIGKVFITSKFCPNCGTDMRGKAE